MRNVNDGHYDGAHHPRPENGMMTDRESEELAQAKSDAITLAQTLHTIVSETDDAEAIRIAMSGLLGTRTGRDYLDANPIHR